MIAGGIDAEYHITATAEVYDPSTGVSTALPPMSTPRYAAAGVVLEDGRLAVIGGMYHGVSLASCEALDGDRWRTVPLARLPGTLEGAGFTTMGHGAAV